MESNLKNSIPIEIPNYSGPLEVLLDLAKAQKVDLTKISITKLADQFLDYIKQAKDLNLELASEYLLMATWLAYLKSKLLLPEDEEDIFKASEVAEKLKLQLKKLELIRLLSDQLIKKDRIGVSIFYRGMKGGIKSINTPIYKVSLYELLKTYATIKMQKAFQTINIPKLPVFTTEEGINQIRNHFNQISDWKNIEDLIPKNFAINKKLRKSGLAGIFAASLELTKQGITEITQKKLFEKIKLEGNRLIINSDNSVFELNALSADEFPKFVPLDPTNSFDLTIPQMKRLFNKTKFAISAEETSATISPVL